MREFKPLPAQPAPAQTVGPIAWLRENLFSSIGNSIVTLVVVFFFFKYLFAIINWAFISANWQGVTQDDCTKDGACWVFVRSWAQQFWYGSFPDTELWRVNLSLVLLVAVIVASFTLPKHCRLKVVIPTFLLLPFICMRQRMEKKALIWPERKIPISSLVML